MSAVLAIALKDLKLLFRVKAAWFFTLCWPLIVAVIFGSLFGGDGLGPVADVHRHHRRGSDAGLEGSSSTRWRRARASTCCGRPSPRRPTWSAAAAASARSASPRASARRAAGCSSATRRRWSCCIDPSRQAETAMLQGFLLEQAAKRMQTLFSASPEGRGQITGMLERVKKQPGAFAGQADLQSMLGSLDAFLGKQAQARRPAAPRPRGARPRAAAGAARHRRHQRRAAAPGPGQWLPDHVPAGHAVGHPRLHDVVRDQPGRRADARHADAPADVAGAVVGAAGGEGPGLLHGDPDRRDGAGDHRRRVLRRPARRRRRCSCSPCWSCRSASSG